VEGESVLLDVARLPGGSAADVALGALLLRRGMRGAREWVRIYVPEPTAAFSRRDTFRPGFAHAVRAVRARDFEPVLRPQGGTLAAYHRGSVIIDHVVREPDAKAGLQERFRHYSSVHAQALVRLGLDARVGELPGEYCPGEFSVNAAGVGKIVGSAQRLTRDGWVFSTVVQVTGSETTRDVVTTAYRMLGYELDPATVRAIEDFVPGVSVEGVVDRLRDDYVTVLGLTRESRLTADLLDELQRVSAASRPATTEPDGSP